MKIINLTILITCFTLINTLVNHETFTHHGEKREFYVHFPETYQSVYPVIIMIHGFGQTSQAILKNTKFHTYANRKGYIVVGAEEGQNKAPMWNFGSNDHHYTPGRNVDDVNYFRRMIQILTEKYKVNQDMVFVTGHNTGAHMAYRLACELSDKIAGVVPSQGTFGNKNVISCLDAATPVTPFIFGPHTVSGFSYNQETCPYEIWKNTLPEFFQCHQVKEVPMMIIEGLKNPFFHTNGHWNDGTPGFEKDGILFHWYSPPKSFSTKYFLEKYQCNPEDVEQTYYKVDSNDFDDFTRCFSSKKNGECQTEVTTCITNGGAQWFGMDKKTFKEQEELYQASFGPQTWTFNNNKAIVKFFDKIREKIEVGEEMDSDL